MFLVAAPLGWRTIAWGRGASPDHSRHPSPGYATRAGVASLLHNLKTSSLARTCAAESDATPLSRHFRLSRQSLPLRGLRCHRQNGQPVEARGCVRRTGGLACLRMARSRTGGPPVPRSVPCYRIGHRCAKVSRCESRVPREARLSPAWHTGHQSLLLRSVLKRHARLLFSINPGGGWLAAGQGLH